MIVVSKRLETLYFTFITTLILLHPKFLFLRKITLKLLMLFSKNSIKNIKKTKSFTIENRKKYTPLN